MVDDPNKLSENDDSFMDEDDFLAADREQDDGDASFAKKQNFKEIWAQNPSLKIFAVVAAVAVFLIAFLVFGGDDESDKPEENSVVRKTAEVSQPPGTAELPPAYEEAVRESNEQNAATAEQTGGSSIPTMIQRPSERIEAPVQVEETDPLSAWRREAEARRIERQQGAEATSDSNTLMPPPATTTPGTQPPAINGAQQNVATTAAAEPPPPLPTGPTPEMLQAMTQQLQQQMQTVMETQVPKESVVVSMNIQPGYDMKKYFPPENAAAQAPAQQNTPNNGVAPTMNTPALNKPLVSAGTIAYAQVLTQANSDVPGPVLAEIASGPLTGGRALGTFAVAQRHLVLQFTRIMKNGVEYPITGIALDPGTTLPGVVSNIDYHIFSRVVLPAAASFIEGFAEAATQQDTNTVITNGTVVTNNTQDLDTREEILRGVNEGAQNVSEFMDTFSNRPTTISVAAGTRIGLLFTSSVFDPNSAAGQAQAQALAQQQNAQNRPLYTYGQQALSNATNGYLGSNQNANGYNNGYNNGYANPGYSNGYTNSSGTTISQTPQQRSAASSNIVTPQTNIYR